jgi:hypothetical protein
MDADRRDARRDEAAIQGFHFEVRGGLSGTETLRRLEASIRPDAFARAIWQTSTIGGRTFVVVMPRAPWSEAGAAAVRRDIEERAAEILAGPVATLSEETTEERPTRTRALAPAVRPADDWYWPVGDRPPTSDYSGAPPIRVAHLDTGVADHPCLHGRYDRKDSRDYVDHPRRPRGHGVWCWGGSWVPWYMPDHGTSTASLIVGGASADDRLSGTVAGLVPPGVVDLIPIRVVRERPLIAPWDEDRVAKAIDWAVTRGRCSIISMSIGAPIWSRVVERAVHRAWRAGVIVCAAAGQGWPPPIWPALTALSGWSVCCGGSTVDQLPFGDSGWAIWPDGYVTISAPSEQMPKATWEGHVCLDHDPTLERSGGTSYAAPYVAGIAALWRARHWRALETFPPNEVVPAFRAILSAPEHTVPWARPEYRRDASYGPGIIDPVKVIEAPPARVRVRRAVPVPRASALLDVQTATG